MVERISRFIAPRSLMRRFTLASLVIVILGAAGIGWWVGEQIKADVIKESGDTTALYVNSFIAPNLQELGQADTLTPAHVAALNELLQTTDLGRRVVTFKVWDNGGHIVFSSNQSLIGRVFPIDQDLARSWNGEVVSGVSNLDNPENVAERRLGAQLLQIYSPIRLSGTNRIIAVAEFYQPVGALNAEIFAAQAQSWLMVGSTMTVIYLLLVLFVRWADTTIGRQEVALRRQVIQLKELLSQNTELHDRVRRAASRIATLDERFLRRISAELHDGPAQELGLALLRFDDVIGQIETPSQDPPSNHRTLDYLVETQAALQRALQEVRSIALGLGLPILKNLTLAEVLSRVVQAHERRTGTQVNVSVGAIPVQVALSAKITTYRLIQEALNNAYRHAGGIGQQVQIRCDADYLLIEVIDQGSGFDAARPIDWEQHLGLAGMRERVESLGGLFQIESEPGHGTRVIARLPLLAEGAYNER